MNILVCNDDGYHAKGLKVLADVASRYGCVRVIAPDRNKTASSHSLTLQRPLSLKQAENGFYYVNGTPTDCVQLALSLFDDFTPDWIFSGINHGVNMGEDVLYSGTVACTTQGYLLGIPSIAFSLDDKSNTYWATAEKAVESVIKILISQQWPTIPLWSVNIPRVQPEALKGIKSVPLGQRRHVKKVIDATNPYNEPVYWLGQLGEPLLNGEETDFKANSEGYVTVTPLTIDRTDYHQLEALGKVFNTTI